MFERPFTIGSTSLLNIPARDLLDSCAPEAADILIIPTEKRNPRYEFERSHHVVREDGRLIALLSRARGVNAMIYSKADTSARSAVTHVLRRTSQTSGSTRITARSPHGSGSVRVASLRELFSSTPDGARIVALTSCGGSLMTIALERRFSLLCTEPDRDEFMCAVANIGRATNYQPIDSLSVDPNE